MRVDELERELRAERREPDPEFARRLDDWAAAGFPRGGELDPRTRPGRPAAETAGTTGLRRRIGALRDSFAHVLDQLRALPPRRVLAPAGAVATFVVVAAVAISQSGELDGDGPAPALEEDPGAVSAQSSPDTAEATDPAAATGSQSGTDGGALKDPGGSAPRRANETLAAPEPAIAPTDDLVAPIPVPPPSGGGGGVAAGTQNRIVDATARITLGAEADEVQDVANGVVEVTDRYDGIVSSSQVTSDQGGARASFELEIPSKRLDAAIADLSELADVVSRTEGGQDITARAVRARRRLAETLQDVQQARAQLIREDDPAERRIIRSRIRFLEATAAGYETELAGVKRQGRFATVAVEVTSDGAVAADDGDWSIGDAADDAVSVLTAVGGILLVSLAVLVPLAALLAVAWLGVTRARRASRERALGP